MSLYLGIDLGTSGLKAVLVTPEGVLSGIGYRPYGIDIPQPLVAQQSTDLWWQALCGAVGEALSRAGAAPRDVRCIGLSGQMHGLVLADEAGHALHPAVLWCDQRSARESRMIRERIGERNLGRWTQNPVSPGFQVCSLLWMRAHKPQLMERARWALLPKDYLRMRMTGEAASEVTDASGTLLFDCAKGDYSAQMIEALSIDREMLPCARHMPWEIAGALTAKAAREIGLLPGTPVAFGGGDQPMQAVGNGILEPGDASLTLGSGGQILSPTAQPGYDPQLRTHTFCHALKNRWYVMGATLNACLSLNWFMDALVKNRDFAAIDREAERAKPGCGGLIFLPYLTGERTPHMDPMARGVFFGLTLGHGRGDMARAVLEGVAFSLMDAMGVLESISPPAGRLILSGGGAQSPLWRQIIADVFGRPIHTSRMREAAGVGAAICAMVADKRYPSLEEACSAIVRHEETPLFPIPENAGQYARSHELFKAAYRANAPLFKKL